MATTQQDLSSYQELFGEPGLDQTAGHTQTILAAFSAGAANASTSTELLAQASTSLDPLPFLAVFGNQVHVLHNIFEVKGSITEPDARHVGEYVAILDDVGAGGRITWVEVPEVWMNRVNAIVGTAAHIGNEIAGEDDDFLMPAAAAADADHEAKTVRHLQPVPYPIAALVLAHAGCATRRL